MIAGWPFGFSEIPWWVEARRTGVKNFHIQFPVAKFVKTWLLCKSSNTLYTILCVHLRNVSKYLGGLNDVYDGY